jgi:SulP family sulfate permease
VLSVWNTGWQSRIAAVATFAATLFLPIQLAVAIGVTLSAILTLYEYGSDVSVLQMVQRSDGRLEEREAAKDLESGQVVVLDVYGHMFYAGARMLERMLPSPEKAGRPVVVLRLRGRTRVGATLIDVLSTYANRIADVGGRLYLSGLSPHVREQLSANGKLDLSGPVQLFNATPILAESTKQAYADAENWLVQMRLRDDRISGEKETTGETGESGGPDPIASDRSISKPQHKQQRGLK